MVTDSFGTAPRRHLLQLVVLALQTLPVAIRHFCLVLPITAYLCGAARAADVFAPNRHTDANLVMAIDASDSIGRHEEWLQQTGLVRGLVHPAFLRAATSGPHGRIGFAAFTWSSDGRFDLLVPWTIIGSTEEAARVSAALASIRLVDRSHYRGGDTEHAKQGEDDVVTSQRLTDISEAVDFASFLLTSASFATSRSVMNICANGIDNVAGGLKLSRDRALARGFTINGMAVSRNADVMQYLHSSLIGGPGAFVMELSDPNDAGEIMMKKLIRDLQVSWRTIGLQFHRKIPKVAQEQ